MKPETGDSSDDNEANNIQRELEMQKMESSPFVRVNGTKVPKVIQKMKENDHMMNDLTQDE